MADSEYRINPDWKDTLVYDEGDGRTLRMDCNCVEPYQVSVPTLDLWLSKTPPWAHERRAIILDRLRATNCVICETGATTSTIHSPEGKFRIEVYYEHDDRGYPMRAIRVISGDGMLLELNGATLAGVVRFPSPGLLTLPFNLNGRSSQIGINIPERNFWFHPTDTPQPLDQLPAMLATWIPQIPARPYDRSTLRTLLSAIFMLAACMVFVAGGIWQTIAGRTMRDHWIGALCVLFFGACALPPIIDLRRRVRGRRKGAEESS